MKKAVSIFLIVLLAVCIIPAGGILADGSNLAVNGDFERLGGDGLPAGWDFSAYESGVTTIVAENDAERGLVVCITSSSDNDAHFVQTIDVKPNTIYRISCYIKTESVENGAGANIALEDLICRTDALLGTNGWTRVELVGRTGSDQTTLAVGCRLGGFSATSRGRAWFDSFTVERLDSYSGEINTFAKATSSNQNNNNNGSNGSTTVDTAQADARTKMAIIMICVYLIAPLAIAFLLRYEHSVDKKRETPLRRAPAQLAPSLFDTTPNLPKKTDTKLHYTKLDWILVCTLTIVYTLLAVTNLGSTKAPDSYWSGAVGDTITFVFDGEVTVSKIWQDGGICENGEYTLTGDDGKSMTMTQKYTQMFRWSKIGGGATLNSKTKTIQLRVTKGGWASYGENGNVWINEIAFFDPEGNLLPVTVTDDADMKAIDEQDIVPEYPSFWTGMYFDELYHARTAYENLNNMKVYEISHPPLGKLIISVGISIFGMNPFGWRIMGALFGAMMLPVMYAFGKRMFGRSWLALLATVLFAFDFMHFSQTRIATIDSYGVFFNLCMTYYMYKFIKMDLGDSLKDTLLPLGLSGLFFGIGCASKWICVYTGAALAIMFFAKMIVLWVKAARINKKTLSDEDMSNPAVINSRKFPQRFFKTCLWCLLFFIVIPVIIYAASYRPYWTSAWKADAEEAKLEQMYLDGELVYGDPVPENVLTLGESLKAYMDGVIENQKYMLKYHSGVSTPHSYQSSWYEWPLSNRPMWFYSGAYNPDGTMFGTISSFGNPAVWWICFLGALAFIIMLIRGRIKLNTEAFFLLICLASTMLPWMFITRTVFIYHYFATVPLIILASVYVLKYYEDRYYYQPKEDGITLSKKCAMIPKIKWIWMGLTVLLFIIFYPVISGIQVKKTYIDALQWLPTWTFRGFWQ